MVRRWYGETAGLPRWSFAAFGSVLALLLGPSAMAQTFAVSPACAQQCNASSTRVRDNRPDIQACLIRCNAAQDYERAAGTVRPQPGPPSHPPSRFPAQAGALRPAAVAASAHRWGAAYLAAAPGNAFGLTVGLTDRLAAHAQAQSACGTGGASCRAALEFTDRCGAVAQARRTLGLYRTADPRTYSVSYAAAGSGPTRETAESAALNACRAQDRGPPCDLAASSCGPA